MWTTATGGALAGAWCSEAFDQGPAFATHVPDCAVFAAGMLVQSPPPGDTWTAADLQHIFTPGEAE